MGSIKIAFLKGHNGKPSKSDTGPKTVYSECRAHVLKGQRGEIGVHL